MMIEVILRGGSVGGENALNVITSILLLFNTILSLSVRKKRPTRAESIVERSVILGWNLWRKSRFCSSIGAVVDRWLVQLFTHRRMPFQTEITHSTTPWRNRMLTRQNAVRAIVRNLSKKSSRRILFYIRLDEPSRWCESMLLADNSTRRRFANSAFRTDWATADRTCVPWSPVDNFFPVQGRRSPWLNVCRSRGDPVVLPTHSTSNRRLTMDSHFHRLHAKSIH